MVVYSLCDCWSDCTFREETTECFGLEEKSLERPTWWKYQFQGMESMLAGLQLYVNSVMVLCIALL